MGQRILKYSHWIWLAMVISAAVALRACHLDYPALSVDEAESCINAMTILERGYPADEYVGLPIFENTLVRPWPGGHPEYEFKDVSYSDRGAAVYHGWLPLYAIAASYWLTGIEPDEPCDPPRVQTSDDDVWWRTVAGRLPSVVFGVLFVVAVYLSGRSMAGPDVGLMASTIAALAPPAVRVAREARYYSATHLLSVVCCLLLWRMIRVGRWADYVLGAVAFALLFHTHVATFTVAMILCGCSMPFALRHREAWSKLLAFAGILIAATVPWALAAGFPGEALTLVPAARQLLVFPDDYIAYLVQHWKLSCVLAVGVLAAVGAYLLRERLSERLIGVLLPARWATLLLVAWLVIGYLSFLLIVPAPSAFLWRLTLGVQGPGIVLAGILLSAAAAACCPRLPTVPAFLVGGLMMLLPSVRRPLLPPPQWNQPVLAAVDYLRSQEFAPGTRVYATPLNHLSLLLLSGMPIQSTAPVHASFFDEYAGDVVILETAHRGLEVGAHEVQDAAKAANAVLDELAAERWAWRLATRPLRRELLARGANPEPPLEELPEFLQRLGEEVEQQAPRPENNGLWDNPAMFRGHEVTDKWGFWQVFFYRFVDPPARSGRNLNYARRINGAKAVVLESTWVVFHAPPPSQP